MENILDSQNHPKKPKTNYQKWAFRFFIYTMITNLTIAYQFANFTSVFDNPASLAQSIKNLSKIVLVCFIMGTICIIQSHRNNEEKKYQYKVAVWGFSILTILTIFTIWLNLV